MLKNFKRDLLNFLKKVSLSTFWLLAPYIPYDVLYLIVQHRGPNMFAVMNPLPSLHDLIYPLEINYKKMAK